MSGSAAVRLPRVVGGDDVSQPHVREHRRRHEHVELDDAGQRDTEIKPSVRISGRSQSVMEAYAWLPTDYVAPNVLLR
jgi:hypothetical protein